MICDMCKQAYPPNVEGIMIDKARIQSLEEVVKSLEGQLEDKQKLPKMNKDLKKKLEFSLAQALMFCPLSEREAYRNAIKIIEGLPNE